MPPPRLADLDQTSQIVEISSVSRFLNINLWSELTECASKDAELEIRGT